MALKMYEDDYGGLPVHDGPELAKHWRAKLAPYAKDKRLFICPTDPSGGAQRQHRWPDPCSYAYFYTVVMLPPGETYRRPKATSPLLCCTVHRRDYGYILARYDGSIELAPLGRYFEVQIEFE